MFEDGAQEGETRFWYSHQLMEWLGYDSPQAFQGVITKAMGACTRLGLDPTEAFIREEVIEDGKPVKTYRLTRFACLIVSMTADSKKPEVAQAKAILAAAAITAHPMQSPSIPKRSPMVPTRSRPKLSTPQAIRRPRPLWHSM